MIMRFRWFPLPIVLFICILSLQYFGDAVDGSQLIDSDDFTGADGSAPDVNRWVVENRDPNDYVRLESNTLGINIVNGGRSFVTSVYDYETHEFTILVEWKPTTTSGKPMDIRVQLNQSGTYKQWVNLWYEFGNRGWGYRKLTDSGDVVFASYTKNVNVNKWYTVNMTFNINKFNVSVVQMDNSQVVFSKNNVAISSLVGTVRYWIGAFTHSDSHNPRSQWDNYKFIDNERPPNVKPIWLSLPHLNAVEDVSMTYNFTANVTDTDGPMDLLRITSHSPFVTDFRGLEVTFAFPNGVTNASVPLVLWDRWDQVVGDINFTVTAVNDPPYHNVPEDHTAQEDIPYHFNFRAFVWDIDNKQKELWLEVDDPYVSVDGLNITATFPEGIEAHEVIVNITDGELSTPVRLRFTVEPVDDPPTIDPMGTIEIIEDQLKVFDVSPFLADVDTPLEELTLLVRNRNCTVEGLTVHILYTLGGFDDVITVQVTDGHSMVQADLAVSVVEWNDPPIAHTPSPKGIVEGEATTVDLGPYIEDEDTPRDQLVLECDDPAVVDVSGFNVTLFYDTWVSQHEIAFSVFDGALRDNASFMVQVEAVNDDPIIVGISDMVAPYMVEMDEGTTIWLTVLVEDEDSESFGYSVDSLWKGIMSFTNGSIRLISDWNVIEEFSATVSVQDAEGGTMSVGLTITILNLNDPPDFPVIVKPQNHTVVEQGALVTFLIEISDPDIAHGQVLTATWSSNVSGQFMERTNKQGMEFTYSDLSLGTHTITVSLVDGEFTRVAWIKLSVIEPYVEPPPDDPGNGGGGAIGPFASTASMMALLVIIVLVVVVAILVLNRSRGSKEPERTEETLTKEGPVEIVIEERSPEGLATLAVQLGEMASTLEEERSREMAGKPPEAPVELEVLDIPAIEDLGKDLSQDELDDREHAKDVREVMQALTQLPRGLPTALWNWDMGDLAKTLVDGESQTTPDGTKVVRIEGIWYNADHTRAGSFLTKWDEPTSSEPEAKGPVDEDDRARKLEQLEGRLLEGAISEETYNRLRKKYE